MPNILVSVTKLTTQDPSGNYYYRIKHKYQVEDVDNNPVWMKEIAEKTKPMCVEEKTNWQAQKQNAIANIDDLTAIIALMDQNP